MGHYDHLGIESRRKEEVTGVFRLDPDGCRPKFYVLDMFPYPSGAGLHVGHPLGYIATDIVARYKKLKGFNVLHPMGFDAFGLPAENYAIQTGRHPAATTEENILRYKEQLSLLGLAYNPECELRTSDPAYYRWTQKIFLLLFDSYYDAEANKARPVAELKKRFCERGWEGSDEVPAFSADTWNAWNEAQKEDVLSQFRLAYRAVTTVNWCPALGTVLANDEVKDGLSERGGHPVEQRPMKQWVLRITAYAERLLNDLSLTQWPASVVEMQKNWIGRSEGAKVVFKTDVEGVEIEVFTTRPDTIFGVSFLVLAPEHPLVEALTRAERAAAVQNYQSETGRRSERERLADKRVSGVFLGSYAIHPFTGKKIPIWAAEYVLSSYGTGAVMGVPGSDARDYAFAQKFGLEIIPVVEGTNIETGAYEGKDGKMIHSDFLDGLSVNEAISAVVERMEKEGFGKRRVTYKMRDAVFSRQRYWGEPFPIVYRDGVAYALAESELPVTLPEVDSYQPTGTGASPLAAVEDWVRLPDGALRETDTMPGWAGSSWYFFRYCDPQNNQTFADFERLAYFCPVDLYVGGAEHAVGHLLYARFWTKVLYDLGLCPVVEPFKKLVNQGMIQGRSAIVYRRKSDGAFVSLGKVEDKSRYTPIRADVKLVDNDKLDIEAFKNWFAEARNASFVCENDGSFLCDSLVEKMSKSFHNVVNPDELCRQYGADTFRMYEMFLGPLEQHKPWNTHGINGVYNFIRRTYNLFVDDEERLCINDEPATSEELKLLHATIKKVGEDIERLSLNTSVSAFMILVNELYRLSCRKRAILEPMLVLLAPFAPHLCAELWEKIGHQDSIFDRSWPEYNPAFLEENSFEYPVTVNGKVRAKVNLSLELTNEETAAAALKDAAVVKFLEGKAVKKVVVVPKRIINVVV